MRLTGVYLGVVEKVNDPDKLGRVKVRVPGVYGVASGAVGAVPIDELPWAIPMGMPAGGSSYSGGISMLPDIGDQVAVQFLDGEPEKPVWQGLMQNRKQAETLKLHEYEQSAGVGFPDRAVFTRYGHSLELKPDKVTLTTNEGQQVLLQNSTSATGGTAGLQTPAGQSLILNDLTQNTVLQALQAAVISAKKVILNAPTSTLIKTERLTLLAGSSMILVQGQQISINTASGAAVIIDPDGNISINSAAGASLSLENDKVQLGEPLGTGMVIESGKLSCNSPQAVFNTSAFAVGTGALYAPIMLTPEALSWFLTHTHNSSAPGAPTGPPLMQFPLTAASTTMRTI